jgi:hypothetical protein
MEVPGIGLLLGFALAVATVWLGVNRWTIKLDSNWPLIYYALLVVFSNMFPNLLNPYVLYLAVICGLFLRFEFLNERMCFFIRIIEVGCFVHIGYVLFKSLLAWVG